eukprot:evm.model.scf_178.6 EVM.evm.TU.scf_178.6   scf_178:59747-64003(-)
MAFTPLASTHWSEQQCPPDADVTNSSTHLPESSMGSESETLPSPEHKARGRRTVTARMNDGTTPPTSETASVNMHFPILAMSGERCMPTYLESTQHQVMVKSSYGAADDKFDVRRRFPQGNDWSPACEAADVADSVSADGTSDGGTPAATSEDTDSSLEQVIRDAAEATIGVLDALVDRSATEALSQLTMALSERLEMGTLTTASKGTEKRQRSFKLVKTALTRKNRGKCGKSLDLTVRDADAKALPLPKPETTTEEDVAAEVEQVAGVLVEGSTVDLHDTPCVHLQGDGDVMAMPPHESKMTSEENLAALVEESVSSSSEAPPDPPSGMPASPRRVQSMVGLLQQGKSDFRAPESNDGQLPRSSSYNYNLTAQTDSSATSGAPLWSRLPTDVPILHQRGRVPSISKHYYHRAVAEMILAARLTRKSPDRPYPHVAVVGSAGMGKSATATAVAHLQGVLDCYPDCLLWSYVGARGKLEVDRLCWIKELYTRVVACLGSPAELLLDGDEYVHATSEEVFVARINRLMAGQQCLLVFDDVQFPEIMSVIMKLNCAALMTMRSMFVGLHFPSCKIFELQALTPAESHQVLFSVVGSQHSDEDFQELVLECKGNPLALVAAATDWLQAERVKVKDAACCLQGRTLGHSSTMPTSNLLSAARVDSSHPALFRSLDAAIDCLSPGDRWCYMMLAVLPQGLYAPVPMLQHLWGIATVEEVEEVVRCLESMALIHCEHDRNSFEKTGWGMHTLQIEHLRSVVDEDGHEELMDEAKRKQVAYLSKPRTFASLLEAVGHWNLLSFWSLVASHEAMAASYLSVVETWWDAIGENGQSDAGESLFSESEHTNSSSGCGNPDSAKAGGMSPLSTCTADWQMDAPVLVLLRLAGFLMMAEQFDAAQTLFLRALVAMKEQKQEDQPKIAMALNSLGSILERANNFPAAEDFYSRALDMYKDLLGEEHPETVALMSSLGGVIKGQGRFQQAESLFRSALDIRTRLGESQLDIAASLNSLGMVLSNLGNFEEAVAHQRKVLEIRRKILGQDHPAMAVSMSNLAVVLSAQGSLKESETLHRKALDVKKKIFGEDHPETAVSMNNLGVVLSDQGKFDEAETLHRRALEISEASFGEDHADVAVSLNNLALVMRKTQRNLEEVEALHRRDLQISKAAYGDDHPNVALSLNNLALVLSDQQKYTEAEILHRRAWEIRSNAFGPDHPFVGESLSNLAGVLESRGKLQEAEMLHRKDLEISRKAFGNEHPSVACSMNNLAGVLRTMGNLKEAEELHRKDLEISIKTYGDEHPSVAVSLNNLAGVLTDQGNYGEAEDMYRRALAIKRKVYGEKHPDFAITLNSLSSVMRKQGKLTEAEDLSRKSLHIRETVYGDSHPSVAASLNNLALVLSAQHNQRTRKSFMGKVSRSFTKCFGVAPEAYL